MHSILFGAALGLLPRWQQQGPSRRQLQVGATKNASRPQSGKDLLTILANPAAVILNIIQPQFTLLLNDVHYVAGG